MAGPWEKYQAGQPDQVEQAPKPWEKYSAPAEMAAPEPAQMETDDRGAWDKLTGQGGERYQLWPERLARSVGSGIMSAVTLPGDVATGKQPVDMNDPAFVGRVMDLSAVATPMSPASRTRGLMASAGRSTKPKVPTAGELTRAAKTGLDEFRDSGLEVKADFVRDWAVQTAGKLREKGLGPQVAKQTNKILNKGLSAPPNGAVATSTDLHALRRTLGNVGNKVTDPTDQMAADLVRRSLDDLISGLPDDAVAAGKGSAVAPFKKAIANYAAAKRSGQVTGIEDAADLRAAVANSGQNTGNAIRQRIASLLLSKKGTRGFDPGEVAALEKVARGSKAANATRFGGNVLGGGGGMGALLSGGGGAAVGAMAGGAPGAYVGSIAAPAAGMGLKKVSDALTRRGLRSVDDLVRQRSPMFMDRAAVPARSPDPYTDIIRALILSGQDPRMLEGTQ